MLFCLWMEHEGKEAKDEFSPVGKKKKTVRQEDSEEKQTAEGKDG